MVGFEGYGQIRELIDSFSNLQMLELNEIRPILDPNTSFTFSPSNIQHLKLHSVEDAAVIEALTPCPKLRSFDCHYVNFKDLDFARAQAIAKLLACASESLEEFSFTVQARVQHTTARWWT